MSNTAFNRIDIDEALKIAEQVGYAVEDTALRAGCCAGPGGKYLCRDKRYVVPNLLKHLDEMEKRGEPLTDEIRAFQAEARLAVQEYREIEKRLGRIVERT